MGRPEGPGCYCYANNVLKQALGEISGQYPYIVLDNEAGLENLSRRIVTRVDVLVIVADPSARGLETVERLWTLAKEMDVGYGRLAIVVNRLRNGELPAAAAELKKKTGADFVLGLADDDEVARFAQEGRTMFELSANNQVAAKLDDFLMQLNLGS
jgi:CO dehydrogenase maturation factor